MQKFKFTICNGNMSYDVIGTEFSHTPDLEITYIYYNSNVIAIVPSSFAIIIQEY